MQQAPQFAQIEMRRQHVLATEIEHRAMPRLALVAKGFDDPHILVFDALAPGGTNHAQEHRPLRKLSLRQTPHESVDYNHKRRQISKTPVTTFSRQCDPRSSKINGLNNAPLAERGNMG
jgi:hypothetical protein